MSRPIRNSEVIRREVARLLNSEIRRHFGRDDDYSEVLKTVLRDNKNWDGFVLAKDFEKACEVEANFDLADILNRAAMIADPIYQRQLKDWLSANSVWPTKKLYDFFDYDYGDGCGPVRVAVVSFNNDYGQYLVVYQRGFTPADPVPWEDVT